MATPNGCLTVGSLFYDVWDSLDGGDGRQELWYIFRGQFQHQEWQTDGVPMTLMKHDIHRQIYAANSGQLDEIFLIGEAPKVATATYPITTSSTGEVEDPQVDPPQGSIYWGKDQTIKYVKCRHYIYNDAETGDVHLRWVGFEAKNDTAYSGEGVEMAKRTADRLYAPDYPCSAWHVMCLIRQTYEKILYENRPAFVVPVFGVLVTP